MKTTIFLALLLQFSALSQSELRAQAAPATQLAQSAQLTGVVLDPAGAVVTRAEIAVSSPSLAAKQIAHTGPDGEFALSLPVGSYRLEVRAEGFVAFVEAGIELDAAAPRRAEVHLELARQAESVEVTATGDTVDTTSTQVGQILTQQKILSVPLNGRSYTDLLALQAGVLQASSAQPNAVVMSGCTSTPPSGDLNPGNLSVSGQRETSNGFSVNGSSVEEDFNNAAGIVPNLDSIAEFRVLTSGFDAEFGNFSGGQVLVTTRSGANAWHGSAFEFARNTALDATNYLSREKAAYDRHQFGGTLGGALKRDKLFVFADAQSTRMTQGVETGRIAVPTLNDRAGLLSDHAAQLTGTVSGDALAARLSQRLGRAITNGEPYYTSSCTASSPHCVFPGAVIPESAWSEPSRHLLTYIPKPNVDEQTFSTSTGNQVLTDAKQAVRLDWNTRAGGFSAYGFMDGYSLDNPYPTAQGGASVPGFNAVSRGRAELVNLGWTRTIGAATANELHLSYLRDANRIGQPVGGVGPSLASQGFVTGEGTLGIVPLNPAVEGIANVSLNSLTFGVDITGERQVNNTFQVTESLSRAVGRHTFKAGANLHADQVNINSNSINNGAFVFQGSETGLDFADFLLGTASTYEQGDAAGFYIRNRYAGLFVEDSWQARPGLTLNYGVRWDMLPPWREKFNQLQTFVLGQQSEVYPGAPRGMVFPGDKGIGATLSATHWANFSPRLGVAWSPGLDSGLFGRLFGKPGTSSIHAGFGLFYTAIEGLSAGIMSACPPYGYDYDSTGGRPLFEEPFVSASTGHSYGQPFPSPIPAYGASRQHPNTSVDWSRYLPITGDPAFYYQNQSPVTGSYSLTVERELAPETVLSLGYVGAQARHLLVLVPANPGNAARCLSVGSSALVAPGTNVCAPFNEGGEFTRANGTTLEARGPFGPLFDGITYQKTAGASGYNAFEATVKHHSRATELLAAYTWSKSIDNSSSLAEELNPIDPGISRAVSAFDLRHNLVLSYSADLRLERLIRGHNRWTQNWQLAGVTRFSTGLPVTLFNNDDTSLIGSMPNGINNNGVDTPDVAVGDLQLNRNPRNGRAAFNTALITIPKTLGTIGTARRRMFTGPGMDNFDLSLEKKLDFGERRELMLRAESFNTFNHAQFFGAASVQGNPDATNFGQIVNAAAPRQMQLAVKFSF